jgi:hypothetical protein
MADASKTVSIIFEGENKTGAALASIEQGLAGIDSAAAKATTTGNLWQDAAGRWRNEAGQFASNAEKAAAGIDELGKKTEASAGSFDKAKDALKLLAGSLIVKEWIDANAATGNNSPEGV